MLYAAAFLYCVLRYVEDGLPPYLFLAALCAAFGTHVNYLMGNYETARQLYFDALRIIGWDEQLFAALGGEMAFMSKTAHEGGFGRCRIVAVRE